MDRNKLCYETPRTESVALRFEGIICQSGDPLGTNGFPSYTGFNNEEEW